jgi:hypothetical protein
MPGLRVGRPETDQARVGSGGWAVIDSIQQGKSRFCVVRSTKQVALASPISTTPNHIIMSCVRWKKFITLQGLDSLSITCTN